MNAPVLVPNAARRAPREHAGAPAAALAQLANRLAAALLSGVQRAAELNIATTRALLAPADGQRVDRVAEAWRFSWRSYEICAATAATALRLCQSQARAGFDELWAALEEGLADVPGIDPERMRELRTAFGSMRAAYETYFDAALQTHRALLALAAGAR
jgi:hypothetical protein